MNAKLLESKGERLIHQLIMQQHLQKRKKVKPEELF